jgi:hypothetical protein
MWLPSAAARTTGDSLDIPDGCGDLTYVKSDGIGSF